MKCPACQSSILHAATECPVCKLSFHEQITRKLSFYFALQKELDRVTTSSNELSLHIKNLSTTISAYEHEIENELEKILTPRKQRMEEEPKKVSHDIPPAQPPVNVQRSAYFDTTEAPSVTTKQVAKPSRAEQFQKELFGQEFNIGQKWLLILGIITMVFGVAFFLKYSFDQGWVGPAGRVSLAYLWGIIFLIAGHTIKKRRFPAFGLMIFGGGIAVLYFATYAAFQIYHLFPQTLSFSVMVLVTVLACTTAVAYETQGLAILGLMGGFLTPILLSTGQDNYLVLFTYMTILNLGILSVAFLKKWTPLQQLGFILTYLLYAAWYADKYNLDKFWPAIIFLNLFYLIYSIIPFAYHFLKKNIMTLRVFISSYPIQSLPLPSTSS
jgi:uncharacterized membrane protein